ncbi:hypothetical protein GX50_04313 [[Emmonsia] crescens]|uniref:Uncharacterized protein n=1 Tax=[Emmonsia] crescens TaxID=73230 RepID=A0A2B7ZHP6_9EURO|nr:hypothetical protein GX50_04313 [Emmonsia crescens]
MVSDESASIIDGFDECREADFFGRPKTMKDKSWLKFLLTSRPYQNIVLDFKNSRQLRGEEKNEELRREISFAIKQDIRKLACQLSLDEEVRDRLLKKLLARPHRTYLWWHLVLEDLRQSDKHTIKALTKRIEHIPSTVEVYEKILSRVGDKQREKTENLLRIVVGARRPLTLAEIDVAFQLATASSNAQTLEGLDLDRKSFAIRIRQLCGFFVYIEDSRVYLINQTAKKFLVPTGSSINTVSWKYSLDKQTTEMLFTQLCVKYLCLKKTPLGSAAFRQWLQK